MWSIGNEEPSVKTEMGLRITQTMKALVKDMDKTRPVSAALCHNPSTAPAVEPLEVLGINYHLPEYELVHKKYPDLPLVAGECCATGTTRGWYLPDNPDRGYIQAYDHDTNDDFLGRERTWKFFMERPWIMGAFQWDGIEHRGESQWPRLCSQSGAIDLYLQRKDAFYQNQSHWTDEPMVHLLPHWNLQGHEGEEIKVVAYTNCEEVELLQDGISLGKQVPGKYGHGEWKVIYQPGKLKVNAGRNGIVEALEEIETTNAPVKLKLHLEDEGIKADGKDVAILTCYAVDNQDRVAPDASPYITIETNEYGKVWEPAQMSAIMYHLLFLLEK
jgi:beta-galactosidase